ncbi:hypothetical protein, conserved [Leishmania tarentolae]|uniref:Uncharacterized protein n=1 Tax=Leishmania tarentolae TaxID=5689 RepID=A0A640KNK8_LEITA|nr:hypothetical protein, conserved [Leishmania tarentolae]
MAPMKMPTTAPNVVPFKLPPSTTHKAPLAAAVASVATATEGLTGVTSRWKSPVVVEHVKSEEHEPISTLSVKRRLEVRRTGCLNALLLLRTASKWCSAWERQRSIVDRLLQW